MADDENLARLTSALEELQADCIAVPLCDWDCLARGHALHFRCKHPAALNIRLDVMTKMRGCDEFHQLWQRRTTLQDDDGSVYELPGIEDLVKAKKTQQDKDWTMIRRLVDAHYEEFSDETTDERVRFWLRESRSPDVLIAVAVEHPELLQEMIPQRRLLAETLGASRTALRRELEKEKATEQEADEVYWRPLVKELEAMRRNKRKKRL